MRAVARHPWWTVAGALIAVCVAVRLALPFAIAMVVEVGDVDISIVRAAIALDDVTAYGPGRAGTESRGRRWFHAQRASIDVAWRPLFDRVIRVQELVLERPFLAGI